MRTKTIPHSSGRWRKRKRISQQSTLLSKSDTSTPLFKMNLKDDEFSWDDDENASCHHKSPIRCLTGNHTQNHQDTVEPMPPKVSPFQSSSEKLFENPENGSISLCEILRTYTNLKQGPMPEELVVFIMYLLFELVKNDHDLDHEKLCTRNVILQVQNNLWNCIICTKQPNITTLEADSSLISIAIEFLLGVYCRSEDTDLMIPFVTCNRYLQRPWSDVFSSLMERDFESAQGKLGDVDTLYAKSLLNTLLVSNDNKDEDIYEEKHKVFVNHLHVIRNGELNRNRIGKKDSQYESTDPYADDDANVDECISPNFENSITARSNVVHEKTVGESSYSVSEKSMGMLSSWSEERNSQIPCSFEGSNEEIIDDILDRTFGSCSPYHENQSQRVVSYVRHGRVIIPIYDSYEHEHSS